VDHGESVKTERYRCIYRQKSSDAIMKCLVNLRLLLIIYVWTRLNQQSKVVTRVFSSSFSGSAPELSTSCEAF
jgi:hypothetical protein